MDRIVSKPAKSMVLIRALVELTCTVKPTPQTTAATTPTLEFSGLRILLAEDNTVNQKLAARLLEKLGAAVHVAANGIEALDALQAADYDVVLMDCQMPQMDGYEASRQLRQVPGRVRNPRIPVIALTAHALATDRAKCLAAGMNDYLTKPIDADRLRQALARAASTLEPRGGSQTVEVTLFDESALLVRTGNDDEFARELIAVFVATATETLARIQATLQTEPDPDLQRQLAHSLKGSAGTVAALAVAAQAAALERATNAADARDACRALLATFDGTVVEWQRKGWVEPHATAFTGARPAG